MSDPKSPTGPLMTFTDIKGPGQPENKQQAQQQNGGKQEKKITKYWLNVGLVRGDKMLTLPMGIPLDDLQAKAIPSSQTKNQDFRNMRIAEKQLWDKIQEVMGSLKPGQSVRCALDVEIRMVDEKQEPTEEEVLTNPYAVGDVKLTQQPANA